MKLFMAHLEMNAPMFHQDPRPMFSILENMEKKNQIQEVFLGRSEKFSLLQ